MFFKTTLIKIIGKKRILAVYTKIGLYLPNNLIWWYKKIKSDKDNC